MGLEKVVDNIRQAGKAEARAAVEAARAEARQTVEAAERRAAEILAKRREEAAVAADALRRRELAAAQLEAKKLRLNVERDVLARVRSEVEAQIAALPANVRKAHLANLAARAGIANGRVLVAKQDEALAKDAGLKVAGTFEGLGGVVVESADGSTSENLRYENILEDVWRASLHEVASELLGEAK